MSWLLMLLLPAAWLLFNLVAPVALLRDAKRIGRGRLPAELLAWVDARGVRFYTAPLVANKNHYWGLSLWAPPFSVVIFDQDLFAQASPYVVRYVIAHELAHFSLGHHRWRWLAMVSGAALLPVVRRTLQRFEHEADAEAERRTGINVRRTSP